MFKSTVFTILFLFSGICCADVVVIVNKDNASAISQDYVKKLYLGMAKKFENGSEANPVNISDDPGLREAFNQKYLKKNQNQVSAYWARLAFSGRAYDLQETAVANVIDLVASDVNAIAYVNRDMVTGSVKVIE